MYNWNKLINDRCEELVYTVKEMGFTFEEIYITKAYEKITFYQTTKLTFGKLFSEADKIRLQRLRNKEPLVKSIDEILEMSPKARAGLLEAGMLLTKPALRELLSIEMVFFLAINKLPNYYLWCKQLNLAITKESVTTYTTNLALLLMVSHELKVQWLTLETNLELEVVIRGNTDTKGVTQEEQLSILTFMGSTSEKREFLTKLINRAEARLGEQDND